MVVQLKPWMKFIQQISLRYIRLFQEVILFTQMWREELLCRSVADKFTFLIDAQATREQIINDAKDFQEQQYPVDVGLSLVD